MLWWLCAMALAGASASAKLEWGLADSQGHALPGWELATLHELNVNRGSFIRAYNSHGLSVVGRSFHASSCCITVADGIRISVHFSGNKEAGAGALFPASVADGALHCRALRFQERMRFHGLDALRADATSGPVRASSSLLHTRT